MSPATCRFRHLPCCFPRVSGDEPLTAEDRQAALKVFPA